MRERLLNVGYLEFRDGFPFEWSLMTWVEQMFHKHNDVIVGILEAHRDSWGAEADAERQGQAAAEAASKAMEAEGLRVDAVPNTYT